MNRHERTRIGIITPDDAVNDDEYWQYVNDDVTLLLDRYRTAQRFEPISPRMVASYGDLDLLAECAETLRITRPQAVVFFCNSCSFVGGAGADLAICRRIQEAAGAPGSTVSTAQVQALRALGVKRVAVGAPYREEVTVCFHRFLEQHGFEVVSSKSLGMLAEWDIGNAAPSVWR
jgi:maleate isomerase